MVVVGCNAIAVTSHTQLEFVETEKSWQKGEAPTLFSWLACAEPSQR
jgi:hypothetical protein